jgi:DNA polymerase-1
MLTLYNKYWRPFGTVLTDIEREGIKINLAHVEKIKQQAIDDSKKKEQEFLSFVKTFQDDPNIHLFNPSSSRQMQQLLHAPFVVEAKPKE